MALKVVKEVNRLQGLKVAPGLTICAGQVAKLLSTDTAGETATVGNTGPYIGLFMDTNISTGLGLNQRDETSGSGLVSVMTNGGYVLVWNDGRGSPYVTTDTYTIGAALYSDENGRITTSGSGTTNLVGYCTKVPASATDSLGIKLVV